MVTYLDGAAVVRGEGSRGVMWYMARGCIETPTILILIKGKSTCAPTLVSGRGVMVGGGWGSMG